MNHLAYISTAFGSCLTLALIFINYIRKYNTDHVQRKLFLAMLCAALVAIAADFAGWFFSGAPGDGIYCLMYAAVSLYLFAQNCTYFLAFVFVDYFAYKDVKRSKKVLIATTVFLALYLASVIANLPLGFYFSISGDNNLVWGNLYFVRLLISHLSILLAFIDILLASKYFKHSQAHLIILFVLITVIGEVLDVVLQESRLVWSGFAAGILYIYFFILQSDSKIDSLTQIGNRSSFNEFIDKLSRLNVKTSYSIVMMDMDRFKEINDTLGHVMGDRALRDLAAIIKDCIRQSDFAARYGGDEFVLAAGAEYNVQALMDRIQESINEQNEKRSRPYQLYISYGYDVYTTKSGESIYVFLAKIDAMMYQQKEERKSKGLPSAITSKLFEEEIKDV